MPDTLTNLRLPKSPVLLLWLLREQWFRVSDNTRFIFAELCNAGTEINNLQFPPRYYRGTRQADCEHDVPRERAVCSAAAAAGSTGHDGSGNDSLPSPHNQSPILIYVCPRPFHPCTALLRCRYLLLTAAPLYSR